MSHRIVAAVAATSAALVATLLPLAGPASAAPRASRPPTVTTLTQAVLAPYNLAVRNGRVWAADGTTPAVVEVTPTGLTRVATGPTGGDVAGLAVTRNAVAWTSSEYIGPQQPRNGKLTIQRRDGATVTADLAGFETRRNPDARVTYGVRNPSPCVRDAFAAVGEQASYTGLVDAHPYSVAAWGRDSWVVADAGANNLTVVDGRGRVRNLAVLPAQPLTITAEMAQGFGITAACVVGQTYWFEAVPTDVEVGPDGWLYVSVLPGGPEDPSLGARGAVYKVNPWTGRTKLVATGFAGATNLAVGRDGTIYVAELFGGKISAVKRGRISTVVTLPGALSVEIEGRTLYAGTWGVLTGGAGSIVKISC